MSNFDTKEMAEFAFDIQVGLEGADVPEYEVIADVGKAAVLAVNLRGLPEVDYLTLRLVAAQFFHIRSDVLPRVLDVLAQLELVKLITQGTTIQKVIPQVPHFDDVYDTVGQYAQPGSLNEIEQATLAILKRVYDGPDNKDRLRNNLGLDNAALDSSLQIGSAAGLIVSRRARGKDIIASPLYFSSNLDGIIDVAARGDTPNLHHVLTLLRQHQGMPLSSIVSDQRIADTSISPEQAELVKALASEGIVKPPAITRPDGSQEQFVFTPAPGKARLSAANREIYEKAMAISAAVRKGQLLPEAYRIRSPQALLYKLGEQKWIRASTEAAHQYKNLTVLGVGRLEPTGGGFHRFRLIDVPENLQAVEIAKSLLAGEAPTDLEQDTQARLLLRQDEQYVKSMLASSKMRTAAKPTVVSQKAENEIQQFLLQL